MRVRNTVKKEVLYKKETIKKLFQKLFSHNIRLPPIKQYEHQNSHQNIQHSFTFGNFLQKLQLNSNSSITSAHSFIKKACLGFSYSQVSCKLKLLTFHRLITPTQENSSMRYKQVILLIIGLFSITGNANADKAIFAGGCFWCIESDFEKLDGVSEVISGFTGGTLKDPTYNGNHHGHYEAVEINYDPNIVSYQELLDHYWVNIDPFDPRGQFCDKGHSYLSAIFVANNKERKLAEMSRKKVVKQFPKQKVVTPILAAATFYPIKGPESFHQDYYKNNPIRYKYYRWGCGRDQRLIEIWGNEATVH